MLQLTKEETAELRSQNAISSGAHGGRRYSPYVFTEQGVAMLSSVLRSNRAVAVNVEIMRAFVELRGLAQSHEALGRRIDKLEDDLAKRFGKNEAEVAAIIQLLREVTLSPKRKRPAGFVPPDEN